MAGANFFARSSDSPFQMAGHPPAKEDLVFLLDRIWRSVGDGVVITDCSGEDHPIVYVNPAFERISGYREDEVIGENCRFLQGKDTDPEAVKKLREAVRAKRECQVTLLNYTKSGTPFWNELFIAPVRDTLGEVTHFVGVQKVVSQAEMTARKQAEEVLKKSHDEMEARVGQRTRALRMSYEQLEKETVERKRAEAALRQSEERFRAQYKNTPIPVYTWQKQGDDFVLVDYNDAALGFSQGFVANFVGRTAREMYGADMPEVVEDLNRCFSGKTSIRRDMVYRFRSTGEERFLHVTYGFVPPDFVAVHAEDITEQRRLEEELRQSQKMEAVGRLAGGVAHDFNNLLTVIRGYSGILLRRFESGDPMQSYLEEIAKAGERASLLTNQLLVFSRKQILEPQALDLNEVVVDLEKMLRRLIRENIELAIHPVARPGQVEADPGQLQQVILNLVVNAQDAMPEGGRLTIETANMTLDEACVLDVLPGEYVVFVVRDTGCGMDEQTRAQIFEPFFTTKEMGKGTGLGLATVYGIVRQSGGGIEVESAPGRGAVFRVYLPRARDGAGREADALEEEMPRGTETVLLVEDEDMVRNLTHRILADSGYRVLEARNGETAVKVCGQHEGSLDLLITDVVMPRMSGYELARRVRRVFPGLPVLYISGYAGYEMPGGPDSASGGEFLQKPFLPQDLELKVRELLDG